MECAEQYLVLPRICTLRALLRSSIVSGGLARASRGSAGILSHRTPPMPRAFTPARAMIGVTLAVTAALLGQPSAAWGPLGHHAVGAVADTLLSPGARVEVAPLLLDDRDPNGPPSGRTTLADVSLWADQI